MGFEYDYVFDWMVKKSSPSAGVSSSSRAAGAVGTIDAPGVDEKKEKKVDEQELSNKS